MIFSDDDQAPKEYSVLRFTDQDLKRLKQLREDAVKSNNLTNQSVEDKQYIDELKQQLPAILARLEAAEDVVEYCAEFHNEDTLNIGIISWRKSKGE